MSQEIAKRTPLQQVVAQVRSPQFAEQVAMALPSNVSPERFQRVAVTAIQQTPELITCDHGTLFASLVKCAQDGLLPDGREAALVIFNSRDKGKVATYMPMIGGFRKIAAEHGWAIDTQCVYEHDDFDYGLGADPFLRHKPPKLGTSRGLLIGAYAVCAHKDGRKQIEVMGRDEIEKVRAVSRSKDRGPWVDWYERQAEKTVGRRAFVKLPKGGGEAAQERVARVVAASDEEYELPVASTSGMTADEANVAAPLTNAHPPVTEAPDDTIEDGEYEQPVVDANGDEIRL